MAKRLILPGLGGSSAGHWQRWWLSEDREARMIEQDDWDHPQLQTWISKAAKEISRSPGALLVGHSLGAILIAHLAVKFPQLNIRGALLVAPADVEADPKLLDAADGFSPIPRHRLPFPSIVVGSTNDPLMRIERAIGFAEAWGSRFYHLGDSGHINIASGFGPWPGGLQLAAQLLSPLRTPRLYPVETPWRSLLQAGSQPTGRARLGTP